MRYLVIGGAVVVVLIVLVIGSPGIVVNVNSQVTITQTAAERK